MSAAERRAGPRRVRWGWSLPVLTLLLLVAGELRPYSQAFAGGPRPEEVVPALVAAYGSTGALAVAVARLETGASAAPSCVVGTDDTCYADITEDNAPVGNGDAAHRPVFTASLVKLFVAEQLLHRAREGTLTLTAEDRAQMRAMIVGSDDAAASSLWVRFDGPQLVTEVAARYGLGGTAPPPRSGQWGETTTTAHDLAKFLSRLPVVAHSYDAALLLFWMRTVSPTAADGFDQRFGLLGPVPGRPAVKQGWMCCIGGQRYLHSVGIVGTRVVVLLSTVPRSVSFPAARAALDAAAAAIPPQQP
jgi:hypothetical protein